MMLCKLSRASSLMVMALINGLAVTGCGPVGVDASTTSASMGDTSVSSGSGNSGGDDTSSESAGAGGETGSVGGSGNGGVGGSGNGGVGGSGGVGATGSGGQAAQCPATVLATGQKSFDIAVDGAHVYWTNDDHQSPMRAPICGGEAAVALAEQVDGYGSELLVDATHVYWSAGYWGLFRVPKEGGAREQLTSEQGRGLAQSSTHLYWFDDWWEGSTHTAAIRRIAKAGGEPESVVEPLPESHPAGTMAVDDTYLYWIAGTGSFGLYRAPLAGGEAEIIGSGEGIPQAMAVDATDVYVASDFSNETWIQRLPKAGGDYTLVSALPGSPLRLAVDGASVFVSLNHYLPNPDSKQGIVRLPKAGGDYEWVVEDEIGPYGMAVDAANLYYTHNDFNSTVRQIPKP